MLKAGIQSARSTNWKSALARSKRNHRNSETAKVTSEAHSAMERAFLAAKASSSWRTKKRIHKAPASGRQVIVESRSEEHTSALPSLMRVSYAVFCLKKKTLTNLITLIKTRQTQTPHTS